VKIIEFAISDIDFQDKTVEKNLADATAMTRQAEAQYDLARAQNATAMAKVEAEVRQNLIKQQNEAAMKKIEAEMKANNMLAQTKAEAEAAYFRVHKEAESRVAAQNIAADAALHQAEAEMKANKAKAEGEKALAEAKLVLINNPGWLELEKMRYQVEMAKYLAHCQTPAVVFNGSDAQGAAPAMFFGQGSTLLNLAMQRNQGVFQPATSPNRAANGDSTSTDEKDGGNPGVVKRRLSQFNNKT